MRGHWSQVLKAGRIATSPRESVGNPDGRKHRERVLSWPWQWVLGEGWVIRGGGSRGQKKRGRERGWERKGSLLGPRMLSRKFRLDSQRFPKNIDPHGGLQWRSGPIRTGFKENAGGPLCNSLGEEKLEAVASWAGSRQEDPTAGGNGEERRDPGEKIIRIQLSPTAQLEHLLSVSPESGDGLERVNNRWSAMLMRLIRTNSLTMCLNENFRAGDPIRSILRGSAQGAPALFSGWFLGSNTAF